MSVTQPARFAVRTNTASLYGHHISVAKEDWNPTFTIVVVSPNIKAFNSFATPTDTLIGKNTGNLRFLAFERLSEEDLQ